MISKHFFFFFLIKWSTDQNGNCVFNYIGLLKLTLSSYIIHIMLLINLFSLSYVQEPKLSLMEYIYLLMLEMLQMHIFRHLRFLLLVGDIVQLEELHNIPKILIYFTNFTPICAYLKSELFICMILNVPYCHWCHFVTDKV